jgi:hypothetical protein
MNSLLKIILFNEVAALKEFSDTTKCEKVELLKDDSNIRTQESP